MNATLCKASHLPWAKSALLLFAASLSAQGDGILREGYAIGGTLLTPSGQTLFSDRAQAGGQDSTSYATGNTNFAIQYTNLWDPGATVSLTGMAIVLRTPTNAGTLTIDFYDPGSNDAFSGNATETLVGSTTATLANTISAAGTYYVNYTSPVDFTSTGTGLVVHVRSNSAIRFKIATAAQAESVGTGGIAKRVSTTDGSALGGSNSFIRTTLAGTASGGIPPATNTANSGGFWDQITWNINAGGSTSGNLGDLDTAIIGSGRLVEYRGQPASETIDELAIGAGSGSNNRGFFEQSSGTLNLTGNLIAGRADGSNDGYATIKGGTLSVDGNIELGTTVSGADGALIVSGGEVIVGGDLRMGDWNTAGAMLRFHNPGSSPAVQIGGSLFLGRAVLDLTFDSNYLHTPGGDDVPLVEYSSRDAQFLNFRRNDEFNCGPNRFRINYDVTAPEGRLAITLTPLPNRTRPSGQPNIVFIFVDDQGYIDLDMYDAAEHPGLSGDSKLPTPNIRAMADSGAKFTSGYVVGPVCHSSRVGLLTGQYPQRFGTEANLGGPNYNGMAVSRRTIPRRLQSAGYRTYAIGKWHLGETIEFHPNNRGFDRFYGISGGSRSFDGDQGGSENTENKLFQNDFVLRPQDEGPYVTDRIGDATVDFIDEHLASDRSADPFYMYVSFTAVHAPMHAQTEWLNELSAKYGLTSSDYTENNYWEMAAMTLSLDDNVRKIREKLADPLGDGTSPGNDSDNILNNTLFVYMNDNGGPEKENGGSNGDNWSNNGALRANKGDLYDGGVRVPTSISWPATIPAGTIVHDPVNSLDVQATFLSAGGVTNADRADLDGIDLLKRVQQNDALPTDRPIFWRRRGPKFNRTAIRRGDWKMLINDSTGARELYNLATNVSETNNLAAGNPTLVEDLTQEIYDWETRLLTPFYNSDDIEFDAGLERRAATNGYRILNRTNNQLWLDSNFREAIDLSQDFKLAVSLRSTEVDHTGSDQLWIGLGDSRMNADFLQVGLNFDSLTFTLTEGKTNTTEVAVIPPADLPVDSFREILLTYQSSTRLLTASLGSTSISLNLTGTYAGNELPFFGYAAASMEGEFTPPNLRADLNALFLDSSRMDQTGRIVLETSVSGSAFSSIIPERSVDLGAFTTDPNALVEYLGGNRYRTTFNPDSNQSAEFFRSRKN